jgi:hypothetical protein
MKINKEKEERLTEGYRDEIGREGMTNKEEEEEE